MIDISSITLAEANFVATGAMPFYLCEIPNGTFGDTKIRLCASCDEYTERPTGYCLECHAAYMQSWRKTHPLSPEQKYKDISRSYAGVYKRRGLLTQQPCEKCGSSLSQMHHHDYSDPLKIEWLCRPCHLGVHRGN